MKKIGIVPAAKLDAVENIWDNIYRIVTTYPTRIYEQGGIPIALLPNVDQYSEELLDMVDAILICGGTQSFDYQFQSIDHAVKHGKPLLGICLGMQMINTYFTVKAESEKRGYEGDLLELFKQMKLEGRTFLKRVEDHVKFPVPLGREDECKHKVLVKKGSLLHKLTGSEEIYGATIHRYCVGEAAPDLEVIGRAEDGTLEAVQYGDKVLGIQFHAEADRMLPGIFKFLTGQE